MAHYPRHCLRMHGMHTKQEGCHASLDYALPGICLKLRSCLLSTLCSNQCKNMAVTALGNTLSWWLTE